VARPRKEEVEEAAAAKEEEEERRGKEGGREGRGLVLVVVEERRRFRAVRTQVGLLARVGTRRRAKAGRAAVWRRKDANIAAWVWGRGGEVNCPSLKLVCARVVLPVLG